MRSHEIDVYRVRLDRPAPAEDRLSPDERERAARFHFERDRVRYVRAHAALRVLLGRALGMPPEAVVLRAGTHGKPHAAGIEFNLSHSGELALVALGPVPLGVDVEQIRTIDPGSLAHRYFSEAERAQLAALPEGERLGAFYRIWARKEAFIKATGEGLSRALDDFDVTLGADAAALLATRPDPDEARLFRLQHLDVGEGYAAALCVRATDARVTLHELPH